MLVPDGLLRIGVTDQLRKAHAQIRQPPIDPAIMGAHAGGRRLIQVVVGLPDHENTRSLQERLTIMLVVFPIEVLPEDIVDDRRTFALAAFGGLAVAFLEALRQFIRFRLAAPPVNDFRIERRLAALRIPPFAPGLPVLAKVLTREPHERNLSPPMNV